MKAPFIVRAGILLSLIALLLFLYYTANVATTNPTRDFEHYYAGAQLVRAGSGAHIYDLATQHAFETRYAHGPGGVFNCPAVTALLFWPTTFLDLNHAFLLWAILTLAVTIGALFLFNRAIRVTDDFLWLVLLSLGFLPLHVSQLSGQVDAFVLFAYAFAFAALKSERPLVAGVALALGLVKFHLVLPFVFIMLMRKQWRFLGGFSLGALLMIGLSVAVSGLSVFTAYPRLLLTMQSLPDGGFEPWRMPNVRGLLFLLIGRDPPLWLLIGLALGILWWTARRWPSLELGFSAAVTAVVLTAYHVYVYDLLLLLIPMAVALKFLAWTSRQTAVFALLAVPIVPYICVVERCSALLALPMLALLSLFVAQRQPDLTLSAPRSATTSAWQRVQSWRSRLSVAIHNDGAN